VLSNVIALKVIHRIAVIVPSNVSSNRAPVNLVITSVTSAILIVRHATLQLLDAQNALEMLISVRLAH
jgi:hypothetical protein